jgi:hypothetical protein
MVIQRDTETGSYQTVASLVRRYPLAVNRCVRTRRWSASPGTVAHFPLTLGRFLVRGCSADSSGNTLCHLGAVHLPPCLSPKPRLPMLANSRGSWAPSYSRFDGERHALACASAS